MRPVCQIWLALVVFLLFPSGIENALGQTAYDLQGVVYGPGGKPVANILMVLENQARAQISQDITDHDGRYRFSSVAAGVYYVIAKPNQSEFQAVTERLELINTSRSGSISSTEKIDFVLKPAARRDADLLNSGSVFAQDVPAAAAQEYSLAMKSLTKEDKEGAANQLSKAIEIFPDYFLALQQLGLVFLEDNKFQQAVPLLQRAIHVNARAAVSHLGLGIAYVNLNRAKEAVEELTSARTLDSKSFRVHLYMGIALLNLGELDSAERSLSEAQKTGGSGAKAARLYLASIYSTQKRYQKAVDQLEAYLRDNPKADNAASVRLAIQKLKAKL